MSYRKKIEKNLWVLSGPKQNWQEGISDTIWGVKDNLKNLWEKLKAGDILIFYVTSPISGVIGIGRVETKFKQDEPLWPDEVEKDTVIYPFRFEFKIDFVLPERDWGEKRIKIEGLPYWGGLNSFQDQDTIKHLNEELQNRWNISFSLDSKPLLREDKPEYKKKTSHKEIKNMLKEIGGLQRFNAEKEYQMENERLDVVWRRVSGSVPTYAFEVQIGGDVYHALGKLKHAWDLWNSNIFLVTEREQLSKVHDLLNGTFHEVSPELSVMTVEDINKLYNSKSTVRKLEKKFGIIKY